MALRMFSRIGREFDRTLPLATLLKHPTIAQLAGLLAPAADEAAAANIVTLAEGAGGPALFCIHGGDGGVLFYRDLAKLLPAALPVHAIESLELGGSGPIERATIAETAAGYLRGVRTLQPDGPYLLAGYSFGGVVAHEMACQLRAAGEKVDFLGLFDTHNPAGEARGYALGERLRVFWRQNSDAPPLARVGRVGRRFADGVRTNRRIKRELHAARHAGPAEAYSDLRRIQVREENWRAMRSYDPPEFDGGITLFKSITGCDKIERADDYGWSGRAAGGVRIVPVAGRHLTLFERENVSSLAEALAGALPPSAVQFSGK
jgi:thioesterase domain-containing protein